MTSFLGGSFHIAQGKLIESTHKLGIRVGDPLALVEKSGKAIFNSCRKISNGEYKKCIFPKVRGANGTINILKLIATLYVKFGHK